MANCETGGVMGPIANLDKLPSRATFNHAAEFKRGKTNNVVAPIADVARMV